MRRRLATLGLAAAMLTGGAAILPVFATGAKAAVVRTALPRAAAFRVGVATIDINPTYPVYMGGYGGGPAGGTITRHIDPTTGRPEDFTARAMAIVEGTRVVELARVDSQGWFAGYQEGPYGISDVRAAAAAFIGSHGAPGTTPADLLVSTLHEHASPTIMGIWGPPAHGLDYLKRVAAATTEALEEAYTSAQPATLSYGTIDAPWLATDGIANANANEGWPGDGSILALWARSLATGATIGTYVSEPGYPNIVYGPGDLLCPGGVSAALLSTDFPTYVQEDLERQLGGTALVASGTLGDQPGPMQGDTAPSPDLPPVTVAPGKTCQQTIAFDDAVHMGITISNLVTTALGQGHPVTEPVVAGEQRYITSPVYNPELLALEDVAPVDGGTPWTELGGNSLAYPVDRSTSPPYQVGTDLGTWVTGLRIGQLLILSEPGEFFPSIHQAWDRSIRGATGVFVVGMGQDQLGYDYPAYAYPFTYYSADENTFNPSLTLGDQVVTAGELVARQLGFGARLTTTAEATALQNHYAKVLQPGVQFIPFPASGDLDPATGGFSAILEGFESAQRFGAASACQPPTVPNPPTCPAGPPPTMGPYHWTFGDGTTSVTPPGNETFFTHDYHSAGMYPVKVTATDSHGHSASMTLPLKVYPALSAQVVRRGHDDLAEVSGGSGQVLIYRWTFPDGTTLYGRRVQVPVGSGPVTLTVTDSTGTMVSTTAEPAGGTTAPTPGYHGLGQPAGLTGRHDGQSAPSFQVGAAKADITPRDLTGVYLGGYGIGPVHPAHGVLRPIYARAIAIRDADGHQVVIAALDLQGHFLAYQQGPYGFADIAADISQRLGIPADHVLVQSTHTHNGPDDLGIWGGVPDSYLAYVKAQTEAAIVGAVDAERPATLSWATADMRGFTGTFGPNTDASHTGDQRDFPIDNQLRVLQATAPSGQVIATLLDYASHATVYGPLDKVSPDWPGATADYLEGVEPGMPVGVRYGYPGSTAVVIEGDLGHSWPAGIPRYGDPAKNPLPAADDNYPADAFGNAVARAAIAAVATAPRPVQGSKVRGTSHPLTVVNNNPLLLSALLLPIPGLHTYRADTPPYGAADALTTQVIALRIGDLLFAGSPGEEYPSLQIIDERTIGAAAIFPFSLADDQLGYLGTLGDYQEAQQCSLTDEGFFMISPIFGDQLLRVHALEARALGFSTFDRTIPSPHVGSMPPATSCTTSQAPAGLPGLSAPVLQP